MDISKLLYSFINCLINSHNSTFYQMKNSLETSLQIAEKYDLKVLYMKLARITARVEVVEEFYGSVDELLLEKANKHFSEAAIVIQQMETIISMQPSK